jgi:hypothetical protein
MFLNNLVLFPSQRIVGLLEFVISLSENFLESMQFCITHFVKHFRVRAEDVLFANLFNEALVRCLHMKLKHKSCVLSSKRQLRPRCR